VHEITQSGFVEVITGSMFSGKTEELLRRLRRARIADQSVAVFTPALDDRYGATERRRSAHTPVGSGTRP